MSIRRLPKPKEKEKFINLLSQNEHISKIIFKLYSKLCNIAMIEILPLWSLQNLIYFSTKDSAGTLHKVLFIHNILLTIGNGVLLCLRL